DAGARCFFRRLLKSLHDVPRVIVTDKLRLSVGCFLAWSTDKADI
ncbi:MAG: hypothetical protein QOD93_2576, partial [Acetobacteraceae bacterium]|nr:hypothetical protein [Acetobacteraceae bacterium]